jgi:hypothetical protein
MLRHPTDRSPSARAAGFAGALAAIRDGRFAPGPSV